MDKTNHSIITISGMPRSGKTTIVSNLKDYYASKGVNIVSLSIGDLLREIARKEGYDVTEFNRQSEKRPEIDKKLDALLKETGKRIKENPKENTIYLIDSRMAWNFIPESFSIRLTVDENEAGKRAFMDTSKGSEEQYASIEEATKKIAERTSSEVKRYKNAYGVDLGNPDNYNLVINTTDVPIPEILDTIQSCISMSSKGLPYCRQWANPGYFFPTQDVRQSENYNYDSIKNSIETSGFHPDEPIQSVIVDGFHFIVDGHNRIGAAFDAKKHLIPYEVLAQDEQTSSLLPGNMSAREFALSNSSTPHGTPFLFDYSWWKFIPGLEEKWFKWYNSQRESVNDIQR